MRDPILVTGAAGFIGAALCERLLADGHPVVGLDDLNDYYDERLKAWRLARLTAQPHFRFERLDVSDVGGMQRLFTVLRPRRVVHLAAQAGVRHSLTNPGAYAQSNLVGFTNLLEGCRHTGCQHLVFASSSSVYGASAQVPCRVGQAADHPVSLYAATKRANELLAHAYSHLYGLPTTGLRFFTVYGPAGRPDMAYYEFTRAILAGEPIEVFNHGDMQRDFTYIDDIVEGVVRVLGHVPQGDPGWDPAHPHPGSSRAPYRLYNIGNHSPVRLGDFIATLERLLGRTAERRYLPMQPGDVQATCADVADLERDVGFRPDTPLEVGLARFVAWYREYHGV